MMLAAVLTGTVPPGRYRLSSSSRLSELRREIATVGWTGRVVDGARMTDRATMIDEFARALEFPDGSGHNWDAFADRLRDLSWIDGDGIVVLWQRSGTFARVDPATWHVAGRVIDDAIGARVGYGIVPLYVVCPGRPEGDPAGDGEPVEL